MRQWKPLVASLVVIALAMGALAAWKHLGGAGGARRNADNLPTANLSPGSGAGSGLEYETVPLEELPALDPLGLWPRDGQRISSVDFWVMWQTTGFSKCRLLASSDKRDWYDLGATGGEEHYLPLNIAYFGSQVSFAVEFQAGGIRYRSTPRTVYFGQGAHFASRRQEFTLVDVPNQTFPVTVFGRNPRRLSLDSFTFGFFPEDLVPFVAHGSPREDDDGGDILVGVQDPSAVKGASVGYLEMYDVVTDTYDRTLITLNR
ncbi:MAG: hypothetical protein H6841_09780 [Planctomycetes bacterium]|nr:hypothetical protein [Planctomycetota bacterium]MCB9935677.1 hypothetical protein [Planctomycetota bacterium]